MTTGFGGLLHDRERKRTDYRRGGTGEEGRCKGVRNGGWRSVLDAADVLNLLFRPSVRVSMALGYVALTLSLPLATIVDTVPVPLATKVDRTPSVPLAMIVAVVTKVRGIACFQIFTPPQKPGTGSQKIGSERVN